MLADNYERWVEGDLSFSASVFADLPISDRVPWAIGVLAALDGSAGWACEPALMSVVLQIGADPKRWKEGHKEFDSLRAQTLRHERMDPVSLCTCVLLLAEVVCKVIYNESGEPAPFDSDSGDWIAKNAASLASKAADAALTHRLWQAVAGRGS